MKNRNPYFFLFLVTGICFLLHIGCKENNDNKARFKLPVASILKSVQLLDSTLINQPDYFPNTYTVYTGNITPQQLLAFACTLIGTPYVYACNDPATGFDCSGFVYYTFAHFHIEVPRSSAAFANIKTEIPFNQARPGDIILFTSSDSAIQGIGHIEIIENATKGQTTFIQSSSGKANAVTISALDAYYRSRFVKLIRVFRQNNDTVIYPEQ